MAWLSRWKSTLSYWSGHNYILEPGRFCGCSLGRCIPVPSCGLVRVKSIFSCEGITSFDSRRNLFASRCNKPNLAFSSRWLAKFSANRSDWDLPSFSMVTISKSIITFQKWRMVTGLCRSIQQLHHKYEAHTLSFFFARSFLCFSTLYCFFLSSTLNIDIANKFFVKHRLIGTRISSHQQMVV